MEIPKPTDQDKARFQGLVPDDDRVEVKPMFGNLGAFVNGNMFMGLFGPDVGLKLPPDQLQELTNSGWGPFGPHERPMGGYVTVPTSMGADEVRRVVDDALAHVGSLPAKPPKPKKATKKAAAEAKPPAAPK